VNNRPASLWEVAGPATLDGMDAALLEVVRRDAQSRRFRRGQALFVEGDRAERLFLIEQGWVLISILSATGRETVLSLAGPGDLLGDASAVDGSPRSASATALGDVATVVTPSRVLSDAVSDPELAIGLLRMLAGRLREADRRRVEFASLDTLGRVSSRLVELVSRFGTEEEDGSVAIELPLSQEQLASWCAASREATVKALASLRSLGYVTTGRRRVQVHDLDGLRARAEAYR
jgi:CRP/FNR family transcriptional regulator, cyclic AMP receptor protein